MAHRNLLPRSISVVNDYAVEIHGAPADPQLDGAEDSVAAAYLDAVTVGRAIHMGLAQSNQALALGLQRSEGSGDQEQCQHPEGWFLEHFLFSSPSLARQAKSYHRCALGLARLSYPHGGGSHFAAGAVVRKTSCSSFSVAG